MHGIGLSKQGSSSSGAEIVVVWARLIGNCVCQLHYRLRVVGFPLGKSCLECCWKGAAGEEQGEQRELTFRLRTNVVSLSLPLAA